MTSTTVAQHQTQPLNFGPEWLRALSTPDASTPIPSSSGGSGSGNVFKFAATKYRYSKDQILALRANVTESLSEDVRNEILENLKDVESVFRPNIIEPLALNAPSSEETAKMNSLSSYISGRTPGGGGGRGGNNSQQSQQQNDSRTNRGGGSMANGRGGSRGRGGRENTFGPNRGNNNSEDTGENGGSGGGDDASVSSSWSRGGYHSRGGGASFGNRVRSYDDREQSQSFRRGGGGGPRQTSDDWRRSRGDDDENNDQNEDSSTPANGSTWTSRGGPTKRGGGVGGGPLEHRTKSNEKWTYNDDRPGPSNSYESNQQRGWRANATVSDRDLNLRRPQGKRDRMPEWMDDNNDGDNQLNSATFEHGTFTGSSALRQNNNSNEQQKLQTQSSTDDTSSKGNTLASKQKEENKPEKSTSSKADIPVVNIPTASETIVPKSTPLVHKSIPAWDDEFEPSDVATTVVESTLAEDHDYSPPISTYPAPHPKSIEPTPPAVPTIPQQRAPPPVIIDDKQWFYKDPQNTVQGPFSSADMERWFTAGYFTILLPVKRMGETQFSTIQQLTKELGHLPFRTDVPSVSPAVQQQPIVPEPRKFNPMTYATPSTTNTAYIDDYLIQQQQQQSKHNVQHSMLFNRQTSMPSAATDQKSVTSPPIISPQLQAYFASQQQQQQPSSSLFTSNLANDPASVYQQQPHIQRSTSATNQQPLYDEIQRSFRPISSQSNTSSFFGTNVTASQSQQQQQPNDIMTRLAQAMQSHGQNQLEKVDEQRRLDQQRREIELERLKLTQQAEQLRSQREEDERRKLEQQKVEDELRKKKETDINKQMMLDQMRDMAKTMDQKKQQQQQQIKPQPKVETDPFLAFQQSLQFQKEQQTKIETQKAENVRRYQQQIREQSQPTPPQQQQPQQTFKLPDTANWARHPSQSNDQSQPLNFAEIQKQEQEQERRAREAAMAAQHLAKSEALNIPTASSSSGNKPGSWARTLFAGNSSGNNIFSSTSSNILSDPDTNENPLPESPITSYNQQATNAPKSRPATNQQSAPWNATSNAPNTSLQDIQRQQSQTETKQQPAHPVYSSQPTAAASTPAWGGIFQQSTPSSQSSSSIFWGDTQQSSSSNKPAATSSNKPSTPWTELKSTAAAAAPPPKSNPTHAELSKSEREARYLFTTTRTQDALSKWTQTQFKDNLQAIDVPTLVQLLKDIDTAEEIVEYVQPYIGSIIKAKEFANGFITKRKQLANAEPELDNDRLNELAMAPTLSNTNSGTGGDEGFQLASSNGQKKKAKKMKGQKIDVKQLGFMVNNRPEQRDDIDKVQM